MKGVIGGCYKQMEGGLRGAASKWNGDVRVLQANEKDHARCHEQMERSWGGAISTWKGSWAVV